MHDSVVYWHTGMFLYRCAKRAGADRSSVNHRGFWRMLIGLLASGALLKSMFFLSSRIREDGGICVCANFRTHSSSTSVAVYFIILVECVHHARIVLWRSKRSNVSNKESAIPSAFSFKKNDLARRALSSTIAEPLRSSSNLFPSLPRVTRGSVDRHTR